MSSTSIGYHREVGRVHLGERFINLEMVAEGFAWDYVQYDQKGEFTAAEAGARTRKRGLWADPNPTLPWEWRAQRRKKLEPEKRSIFAAD